MMLGKVGVPEALQVTSGQGDQGEKGTLVNQLEEVNSDPARWAKDETIDGILSLASSQGRQLGHANRSALDTQYCAGNQRKAGS